LWPAEEPTGEHENIVVKKLLDSSLEARKLLLKEARLINQLNHANIVEFKGICLNRYQRYALLMEYVYAASMSSTFEFTIIVNS
jgi:serine/threonine protein kinase